MFAPMVADNDCWQVEAGETAGCITAFKSHRVPFRFVHIPFSLGNDPVTFHRATVAKLTPEK